MDPHPIEPIAQRRFTVIEDPGRTVTVTIGKPMLDPDPTGDWMCPLDIQGIQDSRCDWIHGIDAVQAVQLALEAARRRLDESGLTLVWSGLEPGETGFPRYVPYLFGRAFAERIERIIDEDVEKLGGATRARAGKGAANSGSGPQP